MKYAITDDCVGCESCVGECPNGAISREADKCRIASAECDGCAKCVESCPVSAIVKV